MPEDVVHPPSHGPELLIGIAGAVGTDLEIVSRALGITLGEVGYEAREIRLSALLDLIDWTSVPAPPTIDDETLDKHISTRMDAGDRFRELLLRSDALALLAILAVTQLREDPKQPAPRTAYIFRSLKHPQEVETLREVYGANFFLISAYSPVGVRAEDLERKIAHDWERGALSFPDWSPAGTARNLIARDMREANRAFGQRLGDTFSKADFFVDARHRPALEGELRRFVELLFAHPFHTPTRHENAMFHAQAAALRSAAPGRQVGCAIANPDGEIITVGTNEVPKAGGGQYWADDEADHRDHNRDDPDVSGTEKRTVTEQILRRLRERGWLTDERSQSTIAEFNELLDGLRVQSLIEFERAVHAEMAAVVEAARRGISVKDAFLYTTTFPCHECTRHIIAAGIRRVFYVQPYPKSLAARLHDDAIVIDPDASPADKVAFLPFVGVAPRRYLELFTPTPDARKDSDGRVAAPKACWFPKGVPGAEPPMPVVEAPAGEAATVSGSRRIEDPDAAGKTELASDRHESENSYTSEEESVESDVVDLAEESSVSLSTADVPIERTSDSLYILREANILVELEDALATGKIDLKEEKSG